MANEEIVVAIGGNLSGLSTALRGVKGMMDKAAHEIKDSFADAFKHLFAPISVAGAFEAVHSLMEEVKNIKRISESTGLDTGITQDLLNLGKASGVASDAIESMLDKFVKNLAPGSDPEEALYEIADKMSKIEDPTERARLAMENFGKSGAKLIPILMQGKDGVKKLADEWGKLDEAQIDLMEHTDQTIEKAESKGKVLLAQYVEGVKSTGDKLKDMPLWKKLLLGPLALPEAIREAKKDTTPDQPDVVTSKALPTAKDKQKAAAAAPDPNKKALDDLRREIALKRANDKTKLKMLQEEDDFERWQSGGSDTPKALKLEEQIGDLKKKIAKDQKEADKKRSDNAKDILKTEEEIGKLGRERERDRMSEYLPTIQELANSGYSFRGGNRWQFQQGPFAQEAQRLMNLQTDAKQSLIWGNKDRFNRDVSQIDELKKALTQAGVMAPDDKLTSIDEKIKDSNTHLAALNAASKTGFVVKGADGDE